MRARLLLLALARTIAGRRVDLADVRPAQPPLGQVVAALNAGRPVRLLAMPPLDGWINGLLKEKFPTAEVTIETWQAGSRSLAEIEQDAKQRVRSLKPDGVLIAIPRSAGRIVAGPAPATSADPQEALTGFVASYGWILNWSLNFGPPTWDAVVVHPDVWEPLATPDVQDALIRRLAAAKDLPLVDRSAGVKAEPVELLRRVLNLDQD